MKMTIHQERVLWQRWEVYAGMRTYSIYNCYGGKNTQCWSFKEEYKLLEHILLLVLTVAG